MAALEQTGGQPLRFGVYELDARAGELRKKGVKIRLQEQPLQILTLLLERPGEVVTREEICKKLWPDGTFVDFDHSLNAAVMRLREALDDDADNPFFIETVPRRGYRFLYPVEGLAPAQARIRPRKLRWATAAALGVAASGQAVARGGGWKWIASAAVVAALAIAGLIFYSRRASALTESDSILLADFVNTTGDAVFDGTLKQALAVNLTESPFLNVVSDQKVHETLRLMHRSPDERVTPAIARQICQRQQVKAMMAGEIAALGSSYVLTLHALNCQTGDSLARAQEEAASKEQVLKALGRAVTSMRADLGESLASIEKFDAPIEQATTSSLEALEAYSLGNEQRVRARDFESLPFFRRAIELDPNFAMAHATLGVWYGNVGELRLAVEHLRKAYQLRDRVTERERLYITAHYHRIFTKEVERQIETWALWKRLYPRAALPYINLAAWYTETGQFERAVAEAHQAVRLGPNFDKPHGNLVWALFKLGRFDEAKAGTERAIALGLGDFDFYHTLFQIAYFRGDHAGMQRAIDALKGNLQEPAILELKMWELALAGRWREAKALGRRGVEAMEQVGLRAVAARTQAGMAFAEAAFGLCDSVPQDVAAALRIHHENLVSFEVIPALVLCGYLPRAQSLIDEIARENSTATMVNRVHLPRSRAVIQLHRGNPQKAIELLESGVPFEAASPANTYARGLAYLRLQEGEKAAAEFRQILDNRGRAGMHIIYRLAQLGFARAKVIAGDTAAASTAYQEFLTAWKDADADLPILKEVKGEYAKLQ